MIGRGPVRSRLEAFLQSGLRAVHGRDAVARVLSPPGQPLAVDGRPVAAGARLHVLALGKAASAMATAVAEWAPERIARGLIVTRDGHGEPVPGFERLEAGHPVPDARSEAAAERALALVRGLGPHDHLLVLLSGGASALTTAPLPGLSTADLADSTDRLLRAGADIFALNAVRKALTRLSGGRLAEAAGACPIDVLIVSDVPGDPIEIIASGPCAPDERGFAEAWRVVQQLGVASRLPDAVRRHLEEGAARGAPCGPPADALRDCRHRVVASVADAAQAAAAHARAEGLRSRILPGALGGEARACALPLLQQADRIAPEGRGPVVLIATGETTVTVTGRGLGGRSQELALACALAIPRCAAEVAVLAAGTDGSDGPTDAAGAFADAGTVERGRAEGVDAAAALTDNDAYHFFEAEGGLLRTGPTHTNVMDLALVWAAPPSDPDFASRGRSRRS